MFNVTGGELVIILLVALIVLGPDKLPDAIRKVGRVYGELRRMSQGFQSEIRDALDEPMREVRDTMNTMKGGFMGEPDPSGPADPADPPAGTRLTASSNGGPGADAGTGATAEVPPTPAADGADGAEPVAENAEAEPVAAPEPEPVAAGGPEPVTAVAEPVPGTETLDELAASPAEPSPPPVPSAVPSPANGAGWGHEEPAVAAPVENERT